MSGLKVSQFVLSGFNYVVLELQKRLKQTVITYEFVRVRPKVNITRGMMEFGIFEHFKSVENGGIVVLQ